MPHPSHIVQAIISIFSLTNLFMTVYSQLACHFYPLRPQLSGPTNRSPDRGTSRWGGNGPEAGLCLRAKHALAHDETTGLVTQVFQIRAHPIGRGTVMQTILTSCHSSLTAGTRRDVGLSRLLHLPHQAGSGKKHGRWPARVADPGALNRLKVL